MAVRKVAPSDQSTDANDGQDPTGLLREEGASRAIAGPVPVSRVYIAVVDKRRWSELDPRLRRAVLLAGAVEAGLKIAALIDLARRPARRVRGSKLGWAVAITVVNAAGAVPIVYFLRGRR